MPLQSTDRLADRGLADAVDLRGLGEAFGFSQVAKYFEAFKLHNQIEQESCLSVNKPLRPAPGLGSSGPSPHPSARWLRGGRSSYPNSLSQKEPPDCAPNRGHAEQNEDYPNYDMGDLNSEEQGQDADDGDDGHRAVGANPRPYLFDHVHTRVLTDLPARGIRKDLSPNEALLATKFMRQLRAPSYGFRCSARRTCTGRP